MTNLDLLVHVLAGEASEEHQQAIRFILERYLDKRDETMTNGTEDFDTQDMGDIHLNGARQLPVYKGYVVDARLKQFHIFPIDGMPEIHSFDSSEGQRLYNEMVDAGLNMDPVECYTPLGQKYAFDLHAAVYGTGA